jgi:hypothetical protein
MSEDHKASCIACLALAIATDELAIKVPKEEQFSKELHGIFAPLQKRRDTGDRGGSVEEGEVIGQNIAAAGKRAGLTSDELQAIAQRMAEASS